MSPRNRPVRENHEYADFAVRIIKSMGKRAAGDPELLPALRDVARLVEDEMGKAIASCLAEGYSWQDIGDRLGISRQAAHKRYGGTKAP